MGGRFEQTKPPKPKVPGAPRSGKAPPPPGPGIPLNRQQRRAAARTKTTGGPAGAPIGLPAPDVAPPEATPEPADVVSMDPEKALEPAKTTKKGARKPKKPAG